MVTFAKSNRFAPSFTTPSQTFQTVTFTENQTVELTDEEKDYNAAVTAFNRELAGQSRDLSNRRQKIIFNQLIESNPKIYNAAISRQISAGNRQQINDRLAGQYRLSPQASQTKVSSSISQPNMVKGVVEKSTVKDTQATQQSFLSKLGQSALTTLRNPGSVLQRAFNRNGVVQSSTLSEQQYYGVNVKDIQQVDSTGKVIGGGAVVIEGPVTVTGDVKTPGNVKSGIETITNEQAIRSFRTGEPITITRTEQFINTGPAQTQPKQSTFQKALSGFGAYSYGQVIGVGTLAENFVNFPIQALRTGYFNSQQDINKGLFDSFSLDDTRYFKIFSDKARARGRTNVLSTASEFGIYGGALIGGGASVAASIGKLGFKDALSGTLASISPLGFKGGTYILPRTRTQLTFTSQAEQDGLLNFIRVGKQTSITQFQTGAISSRARIGTTLGGQNYKFDVAIIDRAGNIKSNFPLGLGESSTGRAGIGVNRFRSVFFGESTVKTPTGDIKVGTSNVYNEGVLKFKLDGKDYVLNVPKTFSTTQTRARQVGPNVFERETGTIVNGKFTPSEYGFDVRIGKGGFKPGEDINKYIDIYKTQRSTSRANQPKLASFGEVMDKNIQVAVRNQNIIDSLKSSGNSKTSSFNSFFNKRGQLGGLTSQAQENKLINVPSLTQDSITAVTPQPTQRFFGSASIGGYYPSVIGPGLKTTLETRTFTTTATPSRYFELTKTKPVALPGQPTGSAYFTPTTVTLTPTTTTTTIISPITTVTTPTLPTSLIGFDFNSGGGAGIPSGFLPGGDLFGGFGGAVGRKRKLKRTPSLFAQYFNIRASRGSPLDITGITERAIL